MILRLLSFRRTYKESKLSSCMQFKHSDQSNQGDFQIIHKSIGQGAAPCTLIRFPIQCAPGPRLALPRLSWGDACCLNDNRQALWQESEAHCPFNSLHGKTVNSPSLWLSSSGMYPSKLGGSSRTVYWPWVARIDFCFWHADEAGEVYCARGGGGLLTWPPACRCDWEQISQIPIRRHLPEMMDRSLLSHQSSPAGERVTPVRNLSSYATPARPANRGRLL